MIEWEGLINGWAQSLNPWETIIYVITHTEGSLLAKTGMCVAYHEPYEDFRDDLFVSCKKYA